MNEACQILCAWAWAKVNLEDLRRDSAPPAQVEDAIHAYKRALRLKRKLDEANRHTDHLTLEDVGLSKQMTLIKHGT